MNTSAHSSKNPKNKEMKENSGKKFFAGIVEYLNMAIESIGALGSNDSDAGQLWMTQMDNSGQVISRQRIGDFNDISWPVMAHDKSIFALQQNQILKMNLKGQIEKTYSTNYKWIKLLGANSESEILGIIKDNDKIEAAIFNPKIQQTILIKLKTSYERNSLYILLEENKAYTRNRKLIIERSERGRRGFDIYMDQGNNEIVNISDSGDDSCRQPFLNSHINYILYIKIPKY